MGTVNYDQDFYGWTVEQVALLQNKQFDQIDLEHIMSLPAVVPVGCVPIECPWSYAQFMDKEFFPN
ncbi:MAG: hypothetical protein RI964_2673 [Pseudomonadota bacterium]|jgi:hypothetical protein